jgi:cell division protein FtsQ
MPVKKLLEKYFPKAKKILLMILLVIFFLVIFFFINKFFLVKEIAVIGNDRKNSLNGLINLKNKNLLYVTEEKIALDLKNKNPWIETVEINKSYPNKLIVKIKPATPIALIKVDQGFFYLNKDGKIIQKIKKNYTNLPQINYYQQLSYLDYQLGNKISYKDILLSLFFIKNLNNLGYSVDTVDIAGFYMIRFNLKDKSILFSTEKDPKEQDYQLEQIIKRFKIEGVDFSSLDLRFDKPVIKIK